MRPASSHLTNDEIDILLSGAKTVEARGLGSVPDSIEQHLHECESCQALLRLHKIAQRTLSSLKSAGPAARRVDCPDESVWEQVAANITQGEKSAEYADHAAACDYCCRQLREALHEFNDSLSGEEKSQISRLKASRRDWQMEMAEKMTAMASGTPAAAVMRKPLLFQYKWIFAMLLVATGLAIWRFHANRNPGPPEDLLAEAYSQRRTLELRFGKARHAWIQEGRGGAQSSLDRPQPLIDAEAIISRGLKSQPDDPAWLQAKGRADLLAWNYDSAIRSFNQALDSTPNSPELETDLASAFFERAEATGQYFDFGAALELLGKALDAQPDNVVALFNRAVIAERMRLYEQSIQDWEHYLRVDPDGEWAAEARQHLESIQKKKSMR